MLTLGVPAVLLKGGHLPGDIVVDLLVTPDETLVLERPRLATRHTHGTGCTLATAVAAGLAAGMGLCRMQSRRARDYVQAAIVPPRQVIGAGHGPLGHLVIHSDVPRPHHASSGACR